MLGITAATAPAIRTQFRVLLRLLSSHLAQHRFLLGDHISLADFALYGPFYAHLFRDPVPGFIIKTEFPLVAEWVERVGGRARGGAPSTVVRDKHGAWAADYPAADALAPADEVPASIRPFLALLLADYLPVLADSAARLQAYVAAGTARAAPENKAWREVPRSLGEHAFGFSPGTGAPPARASRKANTHGLWMLQEALAGVYAGNEAGIDALIAELVGAEAAARDWRGVVGVLGGPWVLARERNRLVVKPRAAGAKL